MCLRLIACLLLLATIPARAQNWAVLVDGGACTLQKAIAFANAGNGVSAVAIGSATTSYAGCALLGVPFPNTTPFAGSYLLLIQQSLITLSTIDNYWYGPNALPPIACDITMIAPGLAPFRLVASHTGDPSPTAANAFRFFYISGGLSGAGLPAGHLTILNATLENGRAKGGNSGGFDAGGGAGMGGAIFNQGTLTLNGVSLLGNSARGGSQGSGANLGGGGIGQDAGDVGGGFGVVSVGSFGGTGATTDGCRGGGGGGFVSGSNGSAGATNSGTGGNGGGLGGLGGSGGAFSSNGGAAGDGGGGGGGVSSGVGCPTPPINQDGRGGNFGSGGRVGGFQVASASFGAGGGGGIGGGGGGGFFATPGGGGGFGGGGGASQSGSGHTGSGGFGGGGGSGAGAGFGAGPGGAGMGGAIFNHRGSVSLLNVTATDNAAIGGARALFDGTADGGGLGAVLFNLNGTVTIDYSTFAGNTLSGTNANDDAHGRSDGTVYSVAYGSKIEDAAASTAVLTINSSIIHGTHADAGNANDDVVVNVVGGNASSYQFLGTNVIGSTLTAAGVTETLPGNAPITADPKLGALTIFSAAQYPLPVLPVGDDSASYFDAIDGKCVKADGVSALTADERGGARPYQSKCSAGAYQFDGNYIFSNGFGQTL